MSTTTTNYGLVKPATTENYNVGVFNSNADAIDTALKNIDNKHSSYTATNMGFKANFGNYGAPYTTARFVLSHDGKRVDIEGAFTRSGSSLAVAANSVVQFADVPAALQPSSGDKQWSCPTSVTGSNRNYTVYYESSSKTLNLIFAAAVTFGVGNYASLDGIGWWL